MWNGDSESYFTEEHSFVNMLYILGTLMELGISPIVTWDLIKQLLAGAKLIGE